MDLGDDIDEQQRPAAQTFDASSAEDALRALDNAWYIGATKKARWMDILGDYAGEELFLIDGDSLIQRVLDDPLLALGKDGDVGFQTLHALYTLEKVLSEFVSRGCNFEIVFWEDNAPITVKAGSGAFVTTSRRLARRILKHHCESVLNIPVTTFQSVEDDGWVRYEHEKKPMFVLLNDGSAINENESLAAERILSQRAAVLALQRSGLPIVLLNGIEFRDSKISSFVFEQRRVGELPKKLSRAVNMARARLQGHAAEVEGETKGSLVEFIKRLLDRGANTKFFKELLYIFVAHLQLLPSLSVAERAQHVRHVHPKLKTLLLEEFLPVALSVAGPLHAITDVDGHIYVALLGAVIDGVSPDLSHLLGNDRDERIRGLWKDACCPAVDLVAFARHFACPMASSKPRAIVSEDVYAVLPFHEPTFDEHLSDIRVPTSEEQEGLLAGVPVKYARGVLFADVHHWHNNRSILPSHLGGKPAEKKSTNAWQRSRQLRSEQRFTHGLQQQAATLMGTVGLKQLVIAPAGNGSDQRVAVSDKRASGRTAMTHAAKTSQKTAKGKPPKMSKKEQLLLDIQTKKDAEGRKTSIKSWKAHLVAMGALSVDGKLAYLDQINRNKEEEAWLGTELRALRLDLLLRLWINDPARDTETARDKYTTQAMHTIADLCGRKVLTKAIAEKISGVLTVLGFGAYAKDLLPDEEKLEDLKMTFKFVDLLEAKGTQSIFPWMRVLEDPVEWQLRLWGEHMDRSIDAASDPRVGFRPDAWQRRVLDAIDRNSSLLVIAPTSSGKTFISYYAMEKVLRDSDNGILVYIAPTKALVSQIAAEVYGRFKKNLKSGSLWAMQTRDYRVHDPQNCQILVTVPDMLAIMLLSPPLARSWTPRIKRIILDEIHSIGQQEGGAVWEQILLLAPCPIIGLSATIGSPEKFNDWLATVQRAHGYEHELVEHPHRYSHLRKYRYVLAKSPPLFEGLQSYETSHRVRFLHPASILGHGPRTMPPDLAFEASDTLSLYHALVKQRSVINLDIDIDDLKPVTFFQIRSGAQGGVDATYRGAHCSGVAIVLGPEGDADDVAFASNAGRFLRNMVHLVSDLHASGSLPAIIFNFDRSYCEIIAIELVNNLERAERTWRQKSPAWKSRVEEWEKWQASAKDRQRQETRAKRNATKDDDGPSASTNTHSWQTSFDPKAPSEGFTFAGVHAYTKEELDEDIGEVEWRSRGVARRMPWIFKALRRGIAVHHSGMNKHYRTLIERLFRIGYVRVMISTGTLALGINAPAKTAVFAGDSPFLTALMYRQCAGRAGRRGYDLFGNVVFYGLPEERVQRLILSKLPSLGGTFPVTSTMCLRLVNLLHGSGNAMVAVDAIRSLMSLPHVTFSAGPGRHQLLHHPMNLYGVAAHLYYTEPSNFALVALLRKGTLHDIAAQANFEEAKREFIILMCHLFDRRYLSRVYTKKEHLEDLCRRYPSRIGEILKVFKGYAVTFAQAQIDKLPSDGSLPLSHVQYLGDGTPCLVRGSLLAICCPARRPLLVRCDLGPRQSDSMEHILNAYIYDFYTHGQTSTLAQANGIRHGDIWFLLEDFNLTLLTLKTALQQLLQGGHDDDTTGVVGTADPAEDDGVDEVEGEELKEDDETRIPDFDWNVYRMVSSAHAGFYEKFKAMWA
ncbi:hypothetical protein BD626DRAFT_495574 [Schizophyllum amplum]|uniref:P-loop containing nucleoside triphosphate hydrolase protein n=1 Tax=Schizophyllum amplum TaxID=97359 RepID=A0A550CEM6_9AGAR|nr:hypothetical protein BD626DRAFT_495574 [Auriculariopsis ampla]